MKALGSAFAVLGIRLEPFSTISQSVAELQCDVHLQGAT